MDVSAGLEDLLPRGKSLTPGKTSKDDRKPDNGGSVAFHFVEDGGDLIQ